MRLARLLALLLLSLATTVEAQTLARLQLASSGAIPVEVPVSVDLDAVTFAPDSMLSLFEVPAEGPPRPVDFQIRAGEPRTLHWIVEPGSSGVFEIVQTTDVRRSAPSLSAARDGELLSLYADERQLLGYRFGVMPAPEGVDPAYARSGFIHPLNTPSGFPLTWIQPPDHYHHYGLWNPWTQVEYRGQTVDFWNLGKREATVRFAGFISISEGPVFTEYEVLHEHVVFGDGGEEVALNEHQRVRAYRPTGSGHYVLDVVSVLTCAGEHPVRLLEYRYGGFGWRGPAHWTHANSEMRTSEGRTRRDADASRARWIRIQGEAGNTTAGLVMMSHPLNHNHPEPLRVWPPEDADQGDVFVNITPTRNTDWLLLPGQRYALRYRLLVFDGARSDEEAEAHWQVFAHPPDVRFEAAREDSTSRSSTSP